MDHLEPSIVPTPADEDREREVLFMFRDIDRSGVLPADVTSFDAADAVLCALAMRLSRAEAEDVASFAPPSLRRIISRCVIHDEDRPEISLDMMGFLRLVAAHLRVLTEDAERISRAVFTAVQKLMPEDEVLDVRAQLPAELDALWYPFGATGRAPFEADIPEPPEVRRGTRPLEEPTETFLRELEQSGVLPATIPALDALQGVLCTLSLELTGTEANDLAGTSRTMQALLEPCVRHRGERPQPMTRPAFLQQVADHLGTDESTADRIARTVFASVRGRLPPDEIQKIDGRIPRSVRALWKPSA